MCKTSTAMATLPKENEVARWTVDEVIQWLRTIGMSKNFLCKFHQEGVNGIRLLHMEPALLNQLPYGEVTVLLDYVRNIKDQAPLLRPRKKKIDKPPDIDDPNDDGEDVYNDPGFDDDEFSDQEDEEGNSFNESTTRNDLLPPKPGRNQGQSGDMPSRACQISQQNNVNARQKQFRPLPPLPPSSPPPNYPQQHSQTFGDSSQGVQTEYEPNEFVRNAARPNNRNKVPGVSEVYDSFGDSDYEEAEEQMPTSSAHETDVVTSPPGDVYDNPDENIEQYYEDLDERCASAAHAGQSPTTEMSRLSLNQAPQIQTRPLPSVPPKVMVGRMPVRNLQPIVDSMAIRTARLRPTVVTDNPPVLPSPSTVASQPANAITPPPNVNPPANVRFPSGTGNYPKSVMRDKTPTTGSQTIGSRISISGSPVGHQGVPQQQQQQQQQLGYVRLTPPPDKETQKKRVIAKYMSDRTLPPLPKMVEVTGQPWFFAGIKNGPAKSKLQAIGQDGAFLVRDSSRSDASNPYTLCLLYNGEVWHLHVRRRPDDMYALGSQKSDEECFESPVKLIEYHKSVVIHLMSENRKGGKVLLTTYPAC